ncbi:hypothetical protein [Streptomyces sp. NRRL B-1347]|uniref:hypothetical protein n=1 Tax=Streptomyces sp. NRRL B-1347 TaxID=1476877 RepID=UPI0004C4D2CB|nr:hypothetical protein [Streptomyces sp. NRRL B-1347]
MQLISTCDAVGRTIRIGDTIGHTTDTDDAPTPPFVGIVTEIELDRVRAVAFPPPGADPGPDRMQWLRASSVFHVGRSLEGQLRALNHLADSGPALFFVSSFEEETVTVTSIDHIVPEDPREAVLCKALLGHAFNVLVRHEENTTVADNGPAIIYAASDRQSLWRVDQTTVSDSREWALCRSLLRYALDLCEQGAPVRADEKGHILP